MLRCFRVASDEAVALPVAEDVAASFGARAAAAAPPPAAARTPARGGAAGGGRGSETLSPEAIALAVGGSYQGLSLEGAASADAAVLWRRLRTLDDELAKLIGRAAEVEAERSVVRGAVEVAAQTMSELARQGQAGRAPSPPSVAPLRQRQPQVAQQAAESAAAAAGGGSSEGSELAEEEKEEIQEASARGSVRAAGSARKALFAGDGKAHAAKVKVATPAQRKAAATAGQRRRKVVAKAAMSKAATKPAAKAPRAAAAAGLAAARTSTITRAGTRLGASAAAKARAAARTPAARSAAPVHSVRTSLTAALRQPSAPAEAPAAPMHVHLSLAALTSTSNAGPTLGSAARKPASRPLTFEQSLRQSTSPATLSAAATAVANEALVRTATPRSSPSTSSRRSGVVIGRHGHAATAYSPAASLMSQERARSPALGARSALHRSPAQAKVAAYCATSPVYSSSAESWSPPPRGLVSIGAAVGRGAHSPGGLGPASQRAAAARRRRRIEAAAERALRPAWRPPGSPGSPHESADSHAR